jgi:hypothetical protein
MLDVPSQLHVCSRASAGAGLGTKVKRSGYVWPEVTTKGDQTTHACRKHVERASNGRLVWTGQGNLVFVW